jgi:TRAP-type C4-dicarboxylate transport system permease small subunit
MAGRLGQRIDGVLIGLSGTALFLMMVIVTADVALRYAFNSPLIWAQDLVALYLLGTTIFLGLTPAMRHGDHIAVDLAYSLLSTRMQALASILIYGATAGVCCVFLYVTANATWLSYVRGEAISGLIAWPIWPSNLPAPIGFAAMLMLCLYRMLISNLALLGLHLPIEDLR